MQMNESSKLNKYLLIAFIMHSFFLFSFSLPRTVNDITTIGETGMQIQMMVLKKSDEVYEKSLASEEIRNKTEDSENSILTTSMTLDENNLKIKIKKEL